MITPNILDVFDIFYRRITGRPFGHEPKPYWCTLARSGSSGKFKST